LLHGMRFYRLHLPTDPQTKEKISRVHS